MGNKKDLRKRVKDELGFFGCLPVWLEEEVIKTLGKQELENLKQEYCDTIRKKIEGVH